MALYFDQKIQSPTSGATTEAIWHDNFAILAVGSFSETTGGSVNLFLDEGEHIQDAVLQRSCAPTALVWHPTKRILVAGWETGEMLIWNDHDHELHEAPKVNKGEVVGLAWSSTGTRLATGYSDGTFIVWKSDSKGRLQQTPFAKHDLNEIITQVIIRPTPPQDPSQDIAALARAAVSGDESALDMFNWKKGKKGAPLNMGSQEANSFFVGCDKGSVYYVLDSGKKVAVHQADSSVLKLLFYEERDILVTITDSLMLTQHTVTGDGQVSEILKVKLSGKSQEPDIIWAGPGILATATGESVVRMWDLIKEDNYVLHLEGVAGYDITEPIVGISYCPTKGILAAGISSGKVAMWNFVPTLPGQKQEPEDQWKLQSPSLLEGATIKQVAWGTSKNMLVVNSLTDVYVLSEQVMSAHYKSQCVVVQTGPSNLSIDNFATSTHQDLKTDIQIKGTYTTGENVAIWNGRKLVVYEITGDKSTIRAAGTFSTESTICCLYEQNVYTIEQGKVQVRTFQGTVKQLISFTEVEGQPVTLEVCSPHFLIVGTENGIIKLYDLSRREAKQIGTAKNMTDVISHFGGFVSLRCNCAGNKVSLCIKKPNGSTDSKLYIWDTELDTLQYFNFETGKGEQDDFAPGTMESDQETAEERGKNQAARDIAGRFPISHFWDPLETKLLVCETKSLPNQQSKLNQSISLTSSMSRATLEQPPEMMIVSLFVTPENGVLIQDSFSMKKSHSSMLGMQVPYYYFARKAEDTDKADANAALDESMNRPQTTAAPSFTSKAVSRRTMRDFIGLEDADKNARDAMMNFSFYLTIGNMDEAFKAIKLIRSESVWENMAKMCVKTRRLDVATVCLGNMGHARGAKALRESVAEPELDARVACLAVQLDLHEDAVRLLKNCKRYDLLNDFYQSNGQWGKAMETAEMYDRVHLRTTYYNYGKHLETKGDVNGAIPNYEKSETHRFEVPRMLFDDTQMLENYIVKNKDKQLRKWWAQYMESAGEMETALQFYEAAADYLSLVRVYCYCGNLDKAAEICNETGDRAACYHLARQYENNNEIKQAIHFFTRAQAYGNAIRLCKENEYEDQLMNLALVSSPVHMIEAARYYENKHDGMDKAVMLYHKGGNFAKALDLAFQSRQLGALQHIAEDLTDTTDPELLQRCADFFMENGQFDKAVDLLAVGKKYIEALKLCHQHQVPMTEELVEKLTPAKGVAENETDERNRILEGIAEVCMNQRQYHLATKKFTQAGNKMKAMKSLLKSGDTEKIIFFAGVSRQKEIYVMAANYLQSLDWRKDPEIMKNIIGFYTKGRALDSLSGFYDACAMVEVDEYQNYDKALGALTEAYKCLTKAKMKNQTQQEEKLAALKTRITLMKKFVTARRAYDEDKDEAVKACQVLLEEPELDSAVRVGDVYGFMIEHYAKKEHWKAAYACMEEMRAKIPKVNLGYYVNMRTIEQVHSALQIPLGRGTGPEINGFRAGSPGDEETGEEVEEDVIDDFADDSTC